MSKPIINVTINPDGTVEVAPSGFKGSACKKATKFLEEGLGLDTSKSKATAEMYEQETVKQGQRA